MNAIFSCQDVTGLLTDYLEEAIPWTQRLRMSLHLNRCPLCMELLNGLKALPLLFATATGDPRG